jgi:uncharacterized membrane protein YphA (DoxX/SURF4 family)
MPRVNIKSIAIWVLRVVAGALFLGAAAMKFTSQPQMVAEFETVGLGQWFRYFTAALELAGGLAILVPRFSLAGAVILLTVDLGAFIAQLAVLHVDWVHTVVLAILLAVLIFLQRPKGGVTGAPPSS